MAKQFSQTLLIQIICIPVAKHANLLLTVQNKTSFLQAKQRKNKAMVGKGKHTHTPLNTSCTWVKGSAFQPAAEGFVGFLV